MSTLHHSCDVLRLAGADATVSPARSADLTIRGGDFLPADPARFFQRRAHFRPFACDDLGGKEGCIAGPGRTDGKGRHRDAAGHLDRRKERVDTIEHSPRQRHAKHRPHGVGRHHPGEVGSHAGGANKDAAAAGLGRPYQIHGTFRGAVSRGDVDLEADTESFEHFNCTPHVFPIARRPHKNQNLEIRRGV